MEETLAKDIHLTQDEVAPAAAAVRHGSHLALRQP